MNLEDDNRYKLAKESIKIDHHIKVDEFANIEWIDTTSIATSQLVTELAYYLELKLNKRDRGFIFRNCYRFW